MKIWHFNMGNKQSHNDSDTENNTESKEVGSKIKSPLRGTFSKPSKDDTDGVRRSSCSSSASDKESNEPSANYLISSPSKPDGIYKLAKELMIRSQNSDTCEGISLETFSKYVCHGSLDLGQALFRDFMKRGKCFKKTSSSRNNLTKEQFIIGSQKVVQLIGDEQLLTYYVQIFSREDETLNQEDVNYFLQSCYRLSLGTTTSPDFSDEIFKMVLSSMFHGKTELSIKYVIHWIQENCSRVVTWMHRYLVNRLTVGFRLLQHNRVAKNETETDGDFPTNLETPVLDATNRDSSLPLSPSSPLKRNFSFPNRPTDGQAEVNQVVSESRLHAMQIWLLGCSLPSVYTRPNPLLKNSPSVNGIMLMDPHTFITRMIASQSPSNWTLLYNSDNDGLSLNRFEHHVMGYRGPTVTFLYGEGNRIFCLAVDQPWKESIHFWGSLNTIVLQLVPEYRVLDRGEKMMFYNTTARGYPFGIQIGTDHKHLCLEIDKEFSRLSYRKIPYRLEAVQVWGCGSTEHRFLFFLILKIPIFIIALVFLRTIVLP